MGELKDRINSDTPDWFKRIRRIGVIMATLGASILTVAAATNGLILPEWLHQVCLYLILAGTVAATVSTTAKKECDTDN